MDVLQGLLQCRCHHSITAHSRDGCESAGCGCRLTSEAVLERAIVEVRQENGHWSSDR